MPKIFTFFLLLIFTTFAFCQQKDSIETSNPHFKFKYQKLLIPAALMTAGVLTDGNSSSSIKNKVAQKRNQHMEGFKNHIDDYAQFAPMIAVYGLEMLGLEARTDWKNRTAILMKGQALNLGMIYFLKKSLNQTRPDGTAHSFPSGHTAFAFAGAAMVAIEYGENHNWVPYAAYGLASGVGIMRIANNKHYISDVLFGAGLGILSMKAAYWLHQYKWNKVKKSEVDPFVETTKNNYL